jgi:hypothetical protein
MPKGARRTIGRNPWFTLPKEDEDILEGLVERHGVARVLAVLSRLQMPKDRKAKADELLHELGL